MEAIKIKITAATSADIVPIRQLLVARAEWLKQQGIQQWQQFATFEQTHQLESDYHNQVLYIAKKANTCLGAVVITPPQEFDCQLWDDPQGYLYLHRFVVALEAQGLAVGSKLLRFAQEKARQEGQGLRLDCRANNEKLIEYYQKIKKLKPCGIRNGYARFQFDFE